jgi:uncharacterized CHY-type Zn-finger protein
MGRKKKNSLSVKEVNELSAKKFTFKSIRTKCTKCKENYETTVGLQNIEIYTNENWNKYFVCPVCRKFVNFKQYLTDNKIKPWW